MAAAQRRRPPSVLFFFNDTATTEIYTLSLHDALPISAITLERIESWKVRRLNAGRSAATVLRDLFTLSDRKSTRLNSSHGYISYAVFCLKKKKPAVPLHTSEVQTVPASAPVLPARSTA